jgi:nicotinamide-nucleotide amidase
MNAVILSIGDELITGVTVDTNSAHISGHLARRGIAVVRHVTVPDNLAAITAAISSAAREAGLVIITGGLGPTADDITRVGLAAAMGVELRMDEPSLRRIEGFFVHRHRPMSESNKVQALMPEGAAAIENECGTAPGIRARVGDADVFVLPGPPHEMMDMFAKRVLPHLGVTGFGANRVLHTFGEGESIVGEQIADLMARDAHPRVGTTVSAGVVSIRIWAWEASEELAGARAAASAEEIRRRLGELVFGEGEESLEGVVGGLLGMSKQTLALAESCTGGMVGQLVTGIPGSSAYFLGGVVAYANATKVALLGVDEGIIATHGAVSAETAGAMAAGARRRFGSDWGVSVTGIAGPDGGSAEKPVGLVYIGLAGPHAQAVHRHVFPGAREFIRRRTSLAALNHLRLAILAR